MKEVADRFVIILDANVLYPFRVRDVLLRFAEAGLFRARWSEKITDEWTARLLEAKPHLEESVKSQLAAMERSFPEAVVTGYEPLMAGLSLPDPDDIHVLAAAIKAGAQHIVTENLKDFPADVLAGFDMEPVSADNFIASTFELYPAEGIAALRATRSAYNNPPMTKTEFIIDLMRVGLGRTAAIVKPEIESL